MPGYQFSILRTKSKQGAKNYSIPGVLVDELFRVTSRSGTSLSVDDQFQMYMYLSKYMISLECYLSQKIHVYLIGVTLNSRIYRFLSLDSSITRDLHYPDT